LKDLLVFGYRVLGIEFEKRIGRKRKSISNNGILGRPGIHNSICYFIPMVLTISFNFSRH
jgi:hypothetical protein